MRDIAVQTMKFLRDKPFRQAGSSFSHYLRLSDLVCSATSLFALTSIRGILVGILADSVKMHILLTNQHEAISSGGMESSFK